MNWGQVRVTTKERVAIIRPKRMVFGMREIEVRKM
jgi:hypothetical protein